MPDSKTNIPIAHIYAQESYHDEAFIVANREGLLAIRQAVDRALVEGYGSSDASVADGEHFDFCVLRNDAPWATDQWLRLAVPYTAEYARDNREDAVWPVQLWPQAEPLASERKGQLGATVSPLIEQLRNLATRAESDDSLLEPLDKDTREALIQFFGQRSLPPA